MHILLLSIPWPGRRPGSAASYSMSSSGAEAGKAASRNKYGTAWAQTPERVGEKGVFEKPEVGNCRVLLVEGEAEDLEVEMVHLEP